MSTPGLVLAAVYECAGGDSAGSTCPDRRLQLRRQARSPILVLALNVRRTAQTPRRQGDLKKIESGDWPVVDISVDGPVPLDVDTWDDYDKLTGATS